MRALVLRDYGEFVVDELADPVPDEDEVLVRILATGICGTDIHGFTGENRRRQPGQVMGHETVGRIEVSGSNTATQPAPEGLVTVNPVISCGRCSACQSDRENLCPSRRIVGVDPQIRSAFAELMAVPSRNVVPLAPELPVEYGALVEPLAVGAHAVARGRCVPGECVFVVGGGPIGQACALAARRAGASVVVTELDARRRHLLSELGVQTVDPASADVTREVVDLLGEPPTLAIDAVGSSSSLRDCTAATAMGARIVLVGMHEPILEIAAYSVSTEERTLIGSFCYNVSDFEQTAAWVNTVPPELAALIEGRVDIAQAPTAFEDAARGRAGPGKVLVTFERSAGRAP